MRKSFQLTFIKYFYHGTDRHRTVCSHIYGYLRTHLFPQSVQISIQVSDRQVIILAGISVMMHHLIDLLVFIHGNNDRIFPERVVDKLEVISGSDKGICISHFFIIVVTKKNMSNRNTQSIRGDI